MPVQYIDGWSGKGNESRNRGSDDGDETKVLEEMKGEDKTCDALIVFHPFLFPSVPSAFLSTPSHSMKIDITHEQFVFCGVIFSWIIYMGGVKDV